MAHTKRPPASWDTFRTFYPLLSLHSPKDYAEIVETYIDGYRKTGWIPECRANNVPGRTQGGSDGTNVLADFAVKYGPNGLAGKLGVDLEEMYEALKKDAYSTPADWNSYGRQVDVYMKYGYIVSAGWLHCAGSMLLIACLQALCRL